MLDKAKEIATKITQNSSVAICAAIRAINAGYENEINGYQVEVNEFGDSFGTEDFEEGTSAFLGKRKADFPRR